MAGADGRDRGEGDVSDALWVLPEHAPRPRTWPRIGGLVGTFAPLAPASLGADGDGAIAAEVQRDGDRDEVAAAAQVAPQGDDAGSGGDVGEAARAVVAVGHPGDVAAAGEVGNLWYLDEEYDL